MINKGYLEKDSMDVMVKVLKSEGVVQLQQGLEDEAFKKIHSAFTKLRFNEKVDKMQYKYHAASSDIINSILNDKQVIGFLQKITGKKILSITTEIVKMKAGDYSLIHNKSPEIILDLNDDWIFEHGGTVMFNDGFGNITRIPCLKNSLIISNGSLFRFIKYINHHSVSDRELVVGKIVLND